MWLMICVPGVYELLPDACGPAISGFADPWHVTCSGTGARQAS